MGIQVNYPRPIRRRRRLKEKGLDPIQAGPGHRPWRLTCTLPDGKEVVYTHDDLMANKPYPGLPFDARCGASA